jgi:hypothetical protein
MNLYSWESFILNGTLESTSSRSEWRRELRRLLCLNSLKYDQADKDKRCVESKYEKPGVRMIQHNGSK